jgi:RNA polymerase sigma factor (sigma-70 family)
MAPSDFTFENAADLVNFLATLARNKVADTARHGTAQRYDVQREVSMPAGELDTFPTPLPRPSQVLAAEDEFEHLLADARPREKLILRRLREGNTHQEIANELGIPEKAIQRLLQRLDPPRPLP